MLEQVENIETKFPRASVLGYPVDLVNIEEALDYAEKAIVAGKGKQVVTINPEMIMQAIENPDLSRILKNADLIIPDGVGVVKILKLLGINNIKRLPGIEFSQGLIEIAVKNGYRLAFLGASNDVISEMLDVFNKKYNNINIVYSHDGYFNDNDEPQLIENLKQANPDILFIALGVPKQEIWVEKYRSEFPSVIMAGVGGSFDVWANRVKRAPLIFRTLGLEWFYRLITQPSRFSRMFPTLPLFFIKVVLDKKNTRKEY